MTVTVEQPVRLGFLVWRCGIGYSLGGYSAQDLGFTGLTAGGARRKARRWIRSRGLSSAVADWGF